MLKVAKDYSDEFNIVLNAGRIQLIPSGNASRDSRLTTGETVISCKLNGIHLGHCLGMFDTENGIRKVVNDIVASLWGCGLGFSASRIFFVYGIFFRWLTNAPTRCGVLYSDTLSARDVGGSTPHGFAYCESLRERWVGSPAGQHLSSSRPSSVVPWDRASPLTPARLSRARALTATRPFGHSPVLPHLDVRRVYLVDSFIARDPQYNAHTTSLIPLCLVTPSVAS